MQRISWLRTHVLSLVLSVLFSLFTVSGIASRLQLYNRASVVSLAVFLVVYGVLFYFLVDGLLHRPRARTAESRLPSHPLMFGLLLLFWLPTYLAFYPGIFGYDGPVQIFYLVTDTLSAHHPVFHTWLLGGCFWLGKLLGGYAVGLAIYAALQGTFVAFAAAYTLQWLKKRNIPTFLWWFSAFFFAANPVIPLLNMNTTKDVPFSALFVLVFLQLIDLLEQGVTLDRSGAGKIARFLLTALVMCLMRNQGYYILFAIAVVTVLVLRRQRLRVAVLLLAAAILGWFCMGPLNTLLGIPKGDAREMLSVPMQQLACVWNKDQQGSLTLSEEDRQAIEELIPPEYLVQYNPADADLVKSGFQTEVLKADLPGYLSLYLRLGLRYPAAYWEAFSDLVSGFWDLAQPGQYRNLMISKTFEGVLGEEFDIQPDSHLEGYKTYLTLYVTNFSDLPLLNLLFSNALPAWVLLALMLAVILRRRAQLACAVLFCAAQWAICLLSPAVLVRYCMPLMLCMPVFAALLWETFTCHDHSPAPESETV